MERVKDGRRDGKGGGTQLASDEKTGKEKLRGDKKTEQNQKGKTSEEDTAILK